MQCKTSVFKFADLLILRVMLLELNINLHGFIMMCGDISFFLIIFEGRPKVRIAVVDQFNNEIKIN